jgi:hypothetical protein
MINSVLALHYEYLKLQGEMYCPPSMSSVLAMLVLVPFGIDVLFFPKECGRIILAIRAMAVTKGQQSRSPVIGFLFLGSACLDAAAASDIKYYKR